MTRRAAALMVATAACAFFALSFGGRLYYFLAVLFACFLLFGFISCLWGRMALNCRLYFPRHKVQRGEEAPAEIQLRHHCMLPLSAITCLYDTPEGTQIREMPTAPFTDYQVTLPMPTLHVGAFSAELKQVNVQDMFCLFSMRKRIRNQQHTYFVLPNPYPIDKPEISLGDEGSAALGRTQEDYNSPEDTRAYQPGDAMKRIHWKLSSRRQELVVRRFEMPSPPDTLILMDTARPLAAQPEDVPFLQDALCETAVAVAKLQMEDGSPVRLPLHGRQANEFVSDQADGLPQLKDMLAALTFQETADFGHVLRLELRRMRRTGAAIIITTRLNAGIVEGVTSIRRMGPSARVYLCTRVPDDPALIPYITQLQHHLVEVCYVTPA
ncbi:MAG: DUF58 domain-containing protein [Clostridia bacterium]|nr:DUF58 domain-containing protein [Clostridia bacterium]